MIWKLFPGALISHLYGNVYILNHKTRTDGFPLPVVRNMLGEPISPNIQVLTPQELRAIADWKEKQ